MRGRSPEGVPDCGQEQRRPRVRSTDQTLGRRACPLGTTGQRPAGITTGLLGSLAGRGRKGLRLIPLSQPIPEARPQPEIAAWSAETAPRTLQGCAPACCERGLRPAHVPDEPGNRAESALHPLVGMLVPRMKRQRNAGLPPPDFIRATINKFIAPAPRRGRQNLGSNLNSHSPPNGHRCGSGRVVGPACHNL